MKTALIATGVAVGLCAALTAASGQAPTTPAQTPSPRPQTSAPATLAEQSRPRTEPAIMLTGCLYLERDVPRGAGNVAERTGMPEDYVIADARVVGEGSSAPGPVAGSGGRMYRVEGIPREQLKALAGKRVEVSGYVDTDDDDSAANAARPDRSPVSRETIDFSDFEATSIREVAGGTACAAKPAAAPAAR